MEKQDSFEKTPMFSHVIIFNVSVGDKSQLFS